MKTLPFIFALSLLSSTAFAKAKPKMFKVEVTNLTKGQPITPPVVAAHSPRTKIFMLGKKASKGLSILAQDGVTDNFVAELDGNKFVKRSVVGSGVILPGMKQSLMIEANDKRFVFSVVGMLARTNDAIVAARGLTSDLKVGQKITHLARVYDAGAEMNTQLCEHIPAPPCNNPGVGTEGGEGFVRFHEGVQKLGDLDVARDTFAPIAAKITVKRVQ